MHPIPYAHRQVCRSTKNPNKNGPLVLFSLMLAALSWEHLTKEGTDNKRESPNIDHSCLLVPEEYVFDKVQTWNIEVCQTMARTGYWDSWHAPTTWGAVLKSCCEEHCPDVNTDKFITWKSFVDIGPQQGLSSLAQSCTQLKNQARAPVWIYV